MSAGLAADPGFVAVSLGSFGTVLSSAPCPLPCAALTSALTSSVGFGWTTGAITLSQPGAAPAQVFFLSGTDMRVSGVGSVSLVSGALGMRSLTGPDTSRGWLRLTLPEPGATLAASAALATLGLAHAARRHRGRTGG